MNQLYARGIVGLTIVSILTALLVLAAPPLGVTYLPAMAANDSANKKVVDVGYSAAFEDELTQVGQISPKEFADRFSIPDVYLPKISVDPATARHFEDFNLDPGHKKDQYGRVFYDFRMRPEEVDVFLKNGFVVSERMSGYSFAEIYYRLFSRDLPVFISTDSVLHAWHRSFDSILMELETLALAPTLDSILTAMSEQLKNAKADYGNGVLSSGIADADYFLAVARSLLKGSACSSQFGQDTRVSQTLRACDDWAIVEFPLFGCLRKVDFSQFKPRGHYTKSVALQRYFRAMMWCGRIDLRVAGNPEESSPQEMAAAVVLTDLLRRSGQYQKWVDFDYVLQTFLGRSDSMTFSQLETVLSQAKMQDPRHIKDLESLTSLQRQLEQGKIGEQEIRGDLYYSPLGSMKLQLPRSFTVLGQRFVLDSWALSKVVYDDIKWNNTKVMRRIPSALEIAFSTLGNRQVVPDLVKRMEHDSGRKFRDGLNYQHNLAAVHQVIERQKPSAWDQNLYFNWLGTLRELSEPTTDKKYPEVMRTKAWSMKTLNTQLGSWAQLRHDTVLYAKQSYSAMASCVYPAGYVEPVPHFWDKMEKMVLRAAETVEKMPFCDIKPEPMSREATLQLALSGSSPMPIHGKQTKERQSKFFRNFAAKVAILKTITNKQLAQQELSASELKFLREVVQSEPEGSGTSQYGGWYPTLFYNGKRDSGVPDLIVADVHTDPPDEVAADPGCILNQGVGQVDFLLVAIENRGEWIVYGSGVLSHYEFETPASVRLTDEEWAKQVYEGKAPPRPTWTQTYLVPAPKPKQP